MESATVFLIVAAAAVYAAWQLAPQALRRWMIGRLPRRAWLSRLETSAAGSGCGSCKGCADAAGEPPKKGTIRVIS